MRHRLCGGAACLFGLLLFGGSARAEQTAPGAAAQAPPAAEPAAAAPAASGTSEPGSTATPGAPTGFSWSGSPKAKRSRRVMARVDVSKPVATYPGFHMLPGGRSEVWLRVSQPAVVTVKRAKRRVAYFIRGAQVGVRNNTNPLVTTHFNSPISRARLRRVRGGAELVVELRESVQPVYTTMQEPGGAMVLRVTVGKAARDYASESRPPMPRSSARSAEPKVAASAPRQAPPIMVLPEAGPQL